MLIERERIEIEEFKQRYEAAFETDGPAPHGYEICPEDYYDYMIHILAKTYGISIQEAEKHREIDYLRLAVFNNLELLRNESILKTNPGENII